MKTSENYDDEFKNCQNHGANEIQGHFVASSQMFMTPPSTEGNSNQDTVVGAGVELNSRDGSIFDNGKDGVQPMTKGSQELENNGDQQYLAMSMGN